MKKDFVGLGGASQIETVEAGEWSLRPAHSRPGIHSGIRKRGRKRKRRGLDVVVAAFKSSTQEAKADVSL